MNNQDLETYKKQVRERLSMLTSVFAKASVGDFSENVKIPEEEDEFTELYVGIQVMIDVIREQIVQLQELNRSLEQKVKDRTTALDEAQHLARLGSWEWDIPRNIVTWSDGLYNIYGIKSEEFKASYEGFLERVHPDDVEMVKQKIQEAFQTGNPFSFDHKIRKPDGTIRTLHAEGEAILNDEKKPIKMYGTGQDITEQKKLEEMLRARGAELEMLNKVMVGREIRMQELKQEIEELKKASNNNQKP